MLPFVDAPWLNDHPEAVVVDVRSYLDGRSGHEAYLNGHLPNAVFVELDRWLAGPPTVEGGRHPLPDPEVFAEGMRRSGIGDDDLVVAYDDDSGVMAARLVWLLRITGHQAGLLDGGITGWRSPKEPGEHTRPRASFATPVWPADRFVSIDELDGVTLVDARPGPRFRGEDEPLDKRPGHIPGALGRSARESSDDYGLLLRVPELRERFADLKDPWVSYCGSGVTACHTLLVAEHLHLPPGRLYAGSWSQYAATDRPAELG